MNIKEIENKINELGYSTKIYKLENGNSIIYVFDKPYTLALINTNNNSYNLMGSLSYYIKDNQNKFDILINYLNTLIKIY